MQKYKLEVVLGVAASLMVALMSACVPLESEQSAEQDGRLNQKEIAVWVESAASEAGKFRVLFGGPKQMDSVEVCKIPGKDLPENFVCDASKEGYQKLVYLTDKGDRKIFMAQALPISDKVGYAVFGKQGNQVLWNNKPRLAYFGLKNGAGAPAPSAVQFTQIDAIMKRTCFGAGCHTPTERGGFLTEPGFKVAKVKLLEVLNSTDPSKMMPRGGRSFQAGEKEIMLQYLNRL